MVRRRVLDEKPFLVETGRRFRAIRLGLGLSRNEVAHAARVHPNTVGVLERGDRDINSLTLTRLCFALGGVQVLLDRKGLAVDREGGGGTLPAEATRSIPESMVVKYMGAAVRARRESLGLSMAELSRAAGVHLNTLWSYETGLTSPSTLTVCKVYLALGISRVIPRRGGLVLG